MKGVIQDRCGELEKFIPYREEGRRVGEGGRKLDCGELGMQC